MPFSDPLADGPVIQRASERALASGMTLAGVIDVVRRVRAEVETPIVLFTYANPVIRMEAQTFARAAADAGVDGVLILDYPIEEAAPLRTPDRGRRAGSDLPHQPDHHGRTHQAIVGLGPRFSVCDLAARRHRRRDELAADVDRLMERVRRARICRSRSASESRVLNRSRPRAQWPTPPSSAAPWSTWWHNMARGGRLRARE